MGSEIKISSEEG